ncbi:putative lipase atg15 [Epicoccum nigrum]|nr:putative lipase atg15 [Epicoccum nigrum]
MVATEFHIDTPRLIISHLDSLQDSHCDFLVDLYGSEQNRARNAVAAPMPDREAARRKIDSNDLIWTSGYDRYLVSLKTPTGSTAVGASRVRLSETLKTYIKIGVVSMNRRRFDGAPTASDLGFGLLPAFQGKGFTIEAAAALVRWFEEEKGQTEFLAFCDPDNESSKGVLQRIRFEEKDLWSIGGMFSDGRVIDGMVYSKGLVKNPEAYGLRQHQGVA